MIIMFVVHLCVYPSGLLEEEASERGPLLVGRGPTSGRSGRKQQAWREPSDLDAD